MGLIGGIISGAGQGVSSILGGAFSAAKMRKNQKIIDAQRNRSQAWYDREYNADFTQRADAQAALGKAREILDSRYKQAESQAAITGATPEVIAMQKQSGNNVLAGITSNIAARADAYKEQVRANYENQQNAADNAEINKNVNLANNISRTASGLAQSFTSAEELPW